MVFELEIQFNSRIYIHFITPLLTPPGNTKWEKKCPTFYSRLTKTWFHNSEDSANLFLKFCFDVVVKTTGRATKTEIEIGMFKYTRIVCQCYSRLS